MPAIRRTNASTARAAVLDALRTAYPGPVAPDRLQAIAGRPYPSRIGELREAGSDVRTGDEVIPSYRLASLTRGEPDPPEWGLRA
jgi:hypothetical protein